ncbi:MAG TPA: DUF2059 domain-containing protein [Candidatus Acidoferrum sp.]|nr:DUF2059 domain-containing protein [Candidatus Acidoferrum sp.]
MKVRALLPCFVFLCIFSTQAVARIPQAASNQVAGEPRTPASTSGTDSAAPSKIDPAKEAAIRQLVNMTGGTNVVNQVMDGMQKNMKPMMANMLPPGDYRDRLIDLFFERFRSKADVRELVDMTVRMYDKYLSEEEIKGLIQFYSTPLGQKTLTVLPKLMVELQSESMKWGQDLGRQSMQEVLSEHPELRKALEDASQSAKPH